ncbi:radical SAM protein [bacterium]|nr:radical SAM protein [bacterium]
MIPRRNIKSMLKKAIAQPNYAFSAFTRRFKSYITYKFADGYSAPPETISLFLTAACNLRCKMCGQWGEDGSSFQLTTEELKERLSLDEAKRFIDEVKHFKPTWTMFGGEPMLHPQWTDIMAYIKANGMRVNIVTNGVFIEKNAEAIVKNKMDEIIFSLDGPEEQHDEIRAVKGTFGRAKKGLEKINKLKKEFNTKSPILHINTTLFEENYEKIDEIVQIAEELEVDHLNFHHLLFLGKEQFEAHDNIFRSLYGKTSPEWSGFVRDTLPKIDPEFLIKMRNKYQSRTKKPFVSFYPNFDDDEIRRYYKNFEFEPTSYANRCMSVWMTTYIFPDGSVRPYHSMNFVAGNIKQKTFGEIWNCEEYKAYRRYLQKNKKFPVCAKGCTEFYRY